MEGDYRGRWKKNEREKRIEESIWIDGGDDRRMIEDEWKRKGGDR